jgi:hypothetical protein
MGSGFSLLVAPEADIHGKGAFNENQLEPSMNRRGRSALIPSGAGGAHRACAKAFKAFAGANPVLH